MTKPKKKKKKTICYLVWDKNLKNPHQVYLYKDDARLYIENEILYLYRKDFVIKEVEIK